MIEVEETGTTYTDGTYEIAKEANQLHVARFLSPDLIIQSPGTRPRLSEAVKSLRIPPDEFHAPGIQVQHRFPILFFLIFAIW